MARKDRYERRRAPGVRTPSKIPPIGPPGDEPMTGAQQSYLHTLASEAGETVEEDLTKAEASRRIDELQEKTGRGKDGGR